MHHKGTLKSTTAHILIAFSKTFIFYLIPAVTMFFSFLWLLDISNKDCGKVCINSFIIVGTVLLLVTPAAIFYNYFEKLQKT